MKTKIILSVCFLGMILSFTTFLRITYLPGKYDIKAVMFRCRMIL